MTTSATGGLLPANSTPAPLAGAALTAFFQSWISGLSGLSGALVRPRWQREPATIPTDTADWIGFGISNREVDAYAAEVHYPTGNGYNQQRRHEVLSFLVSVYGPNADTVSQVLRDGMQMEQNREILQLNSMGLLESGDVVSVPEFLKEKWYYRLDFSFKVRRQIVREYAVLNLLSAPVTPVTN